MDIYYHLIPLHHNRLSAIDCDDLTLNMLLKPNNNIAFAVVTSYKYHNFAKRARGSLSPPSRPAVARARRAFMQYHNTNSN